MLLVELLDCPGHAQSRTHSAGSVVLCRHRSTPEGHHAVAHVFIDGASLILDDFRQPREHPVQKRLQLQRGHAFRQGREASHVAEHHREFPTVCLHAVVLGMLEHLIYQWGRHVRAKTRSQSAFGPAFKQVAVGDVDRGGCEYQRKGGCQRHCQPVRPIQPEVKQSQRDEHHRAQQQRGASRQH